MHDTAAEAQCSTGQPSSPDFAQRAGAAAGGAARKSPSAGPASLPCKCGALAQPAPSDLNPCHPPPPHITTPISPPHPTPLHLQAAPLERVGRQHLTARVQPEQAPARQLGRLGGRRGVGGGVRHGRVEVAKGGGGGAEGVRDLQEGEDGGWEADLLTYWWAVCATVGWVEAAGGGRGGAKGACDLRARIHQSGWKRGRTHHQTLHTAPWPGLPRELPALPLSLRTAREAPSLGSLGSHLTLGAGFRVSASGFRIRVTTLKQDHCPKTGPKQPKSAPCSWGCAGSAARSAASWGWLSACAGCPPHRRCGSSTRRRRPPAHGVGGRVDWWGDRWEGIAAHTCLHHQYHHQPPLPHYCNPNCPAAPRQLAADAELALACVPGRKQILETNMGLLGHTTHSRAYCCEGPACIEMYQNQNHTPKLRLLTDRAHSPACCRQSRAC